MHAQCIDAAFVLQGHTALALACDQGRLEVLRILLAYGADYNATDNQVSLFTALKANAVAQSAILRFTGHELYVHRKNLKH